MNEIYYICLILFFGFFGGMSSSLLSMKSLILKGYTLSKNRNTFRKRIIAMIIDGIISLIVVAAYLSSGIKLNSISSIHIGASSPLLLKMMADQIPDLTLINTSLSDKFQSINEKSNTANVLDAIRLYFSMVIK